MLIAIGFVGAYTTFSTFEYETLRMAAEGLITMHDCEIIKYVHAP